MSEIQKIVPKTSRLLGVVHSRDFRPSIAPKSDRVIGRDRVLFEQKGHALDATTVVRAPLCLISEGDTALFRQVGNDEGGLKMLQTLTENSPTAAVLFDSFRRVNSRPQVAWFSEDSTFAQTIGRAINAEPETLLPMLQQQSVETVALLEKLIRKHPTDSTAVKIIRFSDKEVMESIIEAINAESQKLGFKGKDRKKLGESSAAVVGATHALFPLIVSFLGLRGIHWPNNGQLAGVQGPVHLETNPPHWLANESLKTVARFVNEAAADWNMPHRSLMPCLFKGEPIGEFPALDEEGPQLRRDQMWKLEKWIKNNPFPLSENPIFGHAVGLMDIPEVEEAVSRLIELEEAQGDWLTMDSEELLSNSISLPNGGSPDGIPGSTALTLEAVKEAKREGRMLNDKLAGEIGDLLSRIGFWK